VKTYLLAVVWAALPVLCLAAEKKAFRPGAVWPDADGRPINAHSAGILYQDGVYYWFGEKRGREQQALGVNVYSSSNLYDWKYEGTALAPVEDNPQHDLARGCAIERPKVLYNEKTRNYVMWFHLELKGKGYSAARAAVATSDKATGPYEFLRSFRPNGNMSRDMTLFQDKDGKAYHVFASNDNRDMRICQLSDDFLSPTDTDVLVSSDTREAPAMFEHRGTYYLITSGCSGWVPNAANYYTAQRILGPWTRHDNPMRGPSAQKTFGGQSTFVLPLPGRQGAFIFMADRWKGDGNLIDSRYLWLPIQFDQERLVIGWRDEWDLSWFDRQQKK
jgi:beta-galactosidase